MRKEITYVTSTRIGPCYILSHASCLVCQSYYQTVLAVGRLQALALMSRGHLRLPQNHGWLLGVPLRAETCGIAHKICPQFCIVHIIAQKHGGCLCQALLLVIASKNSVSLGSWLRTWIIQMIPKIHFCQTHHNDNKSKKYHKFEFV